MPDYKTDLLQQIADDERRPPHEREAARRELATADQPKTALPSPRRHGRNANAPSSQQDIDDDILAWFKRDARLTLADRIEVFRSYDPSTQAIIDALVDPVLLALYRESDFTLLKDIYQRTHSDSIRARAASTIRHLAQHSTIAAARIAATEFLDQLQLKGT